MRCIKLLLIILTSFTVISVAETGGLVALDNPDDSENEDPLFPGSQLLHKEKHTYKLFQPSHEWQEVPDGYAVPQGAHVRMNFETGRNEVKLMDDKSEPHVSIISDQSKDAFLASGKKTFSKEELEEALENIKPEDVVTDEDRERVAKNYRSIDELKADFEKISASIKTDVQILSGLIKELNQTGDRFDVDRVLVILEDIEYLSHQIDNGVEVAKMGAVPILIRFANGTNVAVAEAALLCLGSSMQSNRFVQEKALQSGILSVIYQILSQPDQSSLHSRAIYALSTLLRHYPSAQDQFLKTSGLMMLKRIFLSSMGLARSNEKVAAKIIGLVGDLVVENVEALSESAITSDTTEAHAKAEKARRMEYVSLGFREHVIDADWCAIAANLLTSHHHDTREKVLKLLLSLIADCQSKLNLKNFRKILEQLLVEYHKLEHSAEEEENANEAVEDTDLHSSLTDSGKDDYYKRMSTTIQNLLNFIGDISSSGSHVEL